jgi:predicted transcriptional regulator of viral defense system
MLDRLKVETILANRFPGAEIAQRAAAANAIMALAADRSEMETARLRAEFLSMPTLSLTVEQAARLLDMPVASASRMLTALENDGFLTRTHDGRYRLAVPSTY